MLRKNKEIFEDIIRYLKSYYKKMPENNVTYTLYDEKSGDFNVRIYNSNEIIRNQDKNQNSETFNSINKKVFKDNGIDDIFSFLSFGDIPQIFPDQQLGRDIWVSIESKIANKIGNIEFRDSSKKTDIHNAAKKTLEDYHRSPKIEEIINEELLKQTKYMDLDKLFFICAYRIREQLDSGEIVDTDVYKRILEGISFYIDKKAEIFYISEFEDEDIKKEVVLYSSKELEKDLERFVDGKYWSIEKLNEEKRKISEGSTNLNEYSSELIKIMNISRYEIEKVMGYNIDNWVSGVVILNYDIEKIANSLTNNSNIPREKAVNKLFENGKISMQDIIFLYKMGVIDDEISSSISNKIDFSSEINLESIRKKYLEFKEKDKELEKKESLEEEIKLYKITCLNKMTDEEKKKITDEMMYEIYDDNDEISYFFKKGLLDIDVLADWTGKEYVEKLILNSELDDEQIVLYMEKGYISEENIIRIFEERNIYSNEPNILLDKGIISISTFEILNGRNIKKLEERTGHSLGNLEEMEEIDDVISLPYVEKKSDLRATTKKHKGNKSGNNNELKLIQKDARKHLLGFLGCKIPKVVKYETMGEKNPLYNYNFYILQKDYTKEKVERDDIVIAERLYEDRENELGDAINNATYIMKYEDYLILQGKQTDQKRGKKREMIKEVDGAVYTVNHRSGTWARNLLKALAQVDIGHRMNGLSYRSTRTKIIEWLESYYDDEQILDILNLAIRIDREEYTSVEKNNKGTVSDDTDQR